jgi:quercetin dioxygenase-like cupin family protein
MPLPHASRPTPRSRAHEVTKEATVAVNHLLLPDQDEWLAIGGYDVAVRVSATDTNGAYTVAEYRLAPGRLVPPHTHSREQEVSYVLDGEIGLRIGARELGATRGCFVLKPPGIPHTFWNAGPHPAHVLEIISPAGFESYFRELADLYADGQLPDSGWVADLRERYGLIANPEWIADLKTRHGLRLLGE